MAQQHILDLHGRFRKRRMRMTRPRRTIVDILGRTKLHLSAEEIFSRVRKQCPSIGFTTVYRTLDVLEDMGVVVKHHFGDGRGRYELADNPQKPEHHHHLVCTRCRRIIDYDDFVEEEVGFVRKLERQLSKKHVFTITGHVIQFHGVCRSCGDAA
jgi:Fur family ferric uptake transcriptional regulator